MKKIITLITACILAVGLLSACGGNNPETTEDSLESKAEIKTEEEIATEVIMTMYDEAKQLFADLGGVQLPDEEFDEPDSYFYTSDGQRIQLIIYSANTETVYSDILAAFTEQLGEPAKVFESDENRGYEWITSKDDGGSNIFFIIFEPYVRNGGPNLTVTYEDTDSPAEPVDGIW